MGDFMFRRFGVPIFMMLIACGCADLNNSSDGRYSQRHPRYDDQYSDSSDWNRDRDRYQGDYDRGHQNEYDYDRRQDDYRGDRHDRDRDRDRDRDHDRDGDNDRRHDNNTSSHGSVSVPPPPPPRQEPKPNSIPRPNCPSGTELVGRACKITDSRLRKPGGDGNINPCPSGMWVSGDRCVGN